jgi:2-haloacid dehalogenase
MPRVAVFDVNETLSDLAPLAGRFEEVGAPGYLMQTWFAATLRDGFALTAAGTYEDFATVARAELHVVLSGVEGLRRPVPEAAEFVLAGIAELDVHPDVPQGMRRLHAAGVRLITLTNGSVRLAEGTFARAGILNLLEHRLSVDTPRRWKPAPEPYRYAAQVCGVAAEQLVLVAAHPWDIDGAKRAGLKGAWINRGGVAYPECFTPPDVAGADLPAVADGLLTP